MPEDVSYPHSPDCTHSASPFYLFFLITRLFLSYFISAFLSRFVSLRLTRLFSPAAVFFHPHANFLLFFFFKLAPRSDSSHFLSLRNSYLFFFFPLPCLSWRECKQVTLCFLGLPSPLSARQNLAEEAAQGMERT